MNTVSPGLLGSTGICGDPLGSPGWPEKRDFPPAVFPDFCFQREKLAMMKPWIFTLSREGRAGFFPATNFAWIASFPAPPTPVFPSTARTKSLCTLGAMENRGWDIPPSTPRKVIPKEHFRSSGSWRSWGAGETPRNPGFSANPAFSAAGNWGREEQAAPGAAHPYGVFPLLVMDFSQLFPLLNIPFLPTL